MATDKPMYTKYVSPYQYAKLCGVSTTAINNRIKNELLGVEELPQPDGSTKRYINTEEFPPEKTISKIRSYPTETKRWEKGKA
ncbi:hypothetical protein [Pontibacter akesuensis]|uniref:Uncharacterized protein n=1 Tax=Pontibacter akesuensis TaxID=388950 RepID=A0A1I7KNY4_9BACT|nr:hypothetical protein [Pontibacter akesuensis]GHA81821.1 hypothetical protein GCM10007389_40560 [Pontibacter akesuensis]SFU99157.1 hypothetical protein SAMN04487941_3925 [Pontibacter akesuensis]